MRFDFAGTESSGSCAYRTDERKSDVARIPRSPAALNDETVFADE